jgi:hypothetical protein
MSLKNLFCCIREIYNNVVPHLSAVLISCNHSITRIISYTKNGSKQRSIVSVYGPETETGQIVKFAPADETENGYINWLLILVFLYFSKTTTNTYLIT